MYIQADGGVATLACSGACIVASIGVVGIAVGISFWNTGAGVGAAEVPQASPVKARAINRKTSCDGAAAWESPMPPHTFRHLPLVYSKGRWGVVAGVGG